MLQKINALLDQDPFLPFRIVLINGRQYEVTSPLALVPSERLAYLAERGGDWVYFRIDFVCSLESLVDP